MRIATNFKNWYTLLPRAFEIYFRFFPGFKNQLAPSMCQKQRNFAAAPAFRHVEFWVITQPYLANVKKKDILVFRKPGSASN